MNLTPEQEVEIAKYRALARERPEYFAHDHSRPYQEYIHSVAYVEHSKVPMTLLDVGCGSGAFGMAMAARGWEPTYVDVVPDVCLGAPLLVTPAWDMPFKDQFFQLTTSFDCLEHLLEEDVEKAIAEMFRVTVDGGYVVIKPAFRPSGSVGMEGEALHPTVQPPEWWKSLIYPYGDPITKFTDCFIVRKS